MKKLNNKGFAISTLLYGLLLVAFLTVSLLMSLMATNRKNTSTLVKKIEEELNRYSETATEFSYTGDVQEFIVPYGKAGWYKIELWGAAGGTANEAYGGKGAYTSGIAYLEENTYLYFYIGEQGEAKLQESNRGGYNGGGYSGKNETAKSFGGGGATDVRTVSGNWNDSKSLRSRIMVAAGGSGAVIHNSGLKISGGNGGTLIGEQGEIYGTYTLPTAPTQISAGNDAAHVNKNGGFGYGVQSNISGWGGGAGSGYYGGTTGHGTGGNGGSSYISGYSGVNSINASGLHTNTTKSYTGLYFINGVMIPGVNDGDGKAKIELISLDKPTPRNNHLKGVRYIKNCVTTSQTNGGYELWSEIQAIEEGINRAKDKAIIFNGTNIAAGNKFTDGDITKISGTTTSGTIGEKCLTVDLGKTYDLDEISVFRHYNSGNSYNKDRIEVSSDNTSWKELKSWTNADLAAKEGAEGNRISSQDTLTNIPTGNYYLISATTNNQALNLSGTNVTLVAFTGEKNQKWTIEAVEDSYKLTENKNQHTLKAAEGAIANSENVNATSKYSFTTAEHWSINWLQNGYYRIKNKANPSYCLAKDSSNNNVIISTCNDTKNQQFKLIPADV